MDAEMPASDAPEAQSHDGDAADDSAAAPPSGDTTSTADTVDNTPADDKPASTCASCHKPNARLKCSRCKRAKYCDKNCFKSDWPYHRRTCVSAADKAKQEAREADEKEAQKREKAAKKAAKKAKTTDKTTSSFGSAAGAGAGAGAADAGSEDGGDASGSSTSAAAAPTRGKSDVTDAHVDEEDGEALKAIKSGYRYFSRKLPEHEAALIGDITPKRLDGDAAPNAGGGATPASSDAQTADSGSAWNSGATTWEDKDHTKWGEERLEHYMTQVEVDVAGASVSCTGVDSFDGFMNVAFSRGKKRYICDLTFTALLDVAATVGDDTKTGKVKVTFRDVSPDDADEGTLDVEVSVGSPSPHKSVRDAVREACKAPSGVVYRELLAAVQRLMAQFRSEK